MPSKANPFGKADPLAPNGGRGAWGSSTAGFGQSYDEQAADRSGEEYDVVDVTGDAHSGPQTGKKTGKFASFKGEKNGSVAKREQELSRWQADLERREQQLGAGGQSSRRGNVDDIKNFPPCCHIAHHDISKDIPHGKRSITRMGFLLWLFTSITLFYCFVATTICVLISDAVKVESAAIISVVLVAICGIPGGWVLWYKRFYKGMISDGAGSFCMFFCFFMIHIAWCILAAISPPLGDFVNGAGAYSMGWMTVIEFKDADGNNDKVAMILCIAGASAWTANVLFSIVFLARGYKFFRGRSVEDERQKDQRSSNV